MKFLDICFDLDETLIPNTYLYHRPILECALLISSALGHRCPYPPDLLALQYEIDHAAMLASGFGLDRFPSTWVSTYETLAKKAGIVPDPDLSARLRKTASAFADGPFKPFDGVPEALAEIQSRGYRQHLITSGDDALQRRKIDDAGLARFFESVHIIGSNKKAVIDAIVGDRADRAVMVGDSKKSDISPALELGMTAIWVPGNTWPLVKTDVVPTHEIASVRDLPALLEKLETK